MNPNDKFLLIVPGDLRLLEIIVYERQHKFENYQTMEWFLIATFGRLRKQNIQDKKTFK